MEPADGAPTGSNIFVLSDSCGFAGAFLSRGVAEDTARRHALVPMVIQAFPFAAQCAAEKVWVVLYRANDAVAFVSNDRDEAERVHEALGKIGLTFYEDSIDHWEHAVGVLSENAAERLRAVDLAHRMYAGCAVEEESLRIEEADLAKAEQFLDFGITKGTAAAAAVAAVPEACPRVSILDHTVHIYDPLAGTAAGSSMES
jgi:hypothetical protein